MPIVSGQDGTAYDLTDEQAQEYYGIRDFRAGQEYLKGTKARGGASATSLAPAASGYGQGGALAPLPRQPQASNPLASPAGQYTPTEAGNLVGHYESEGLARKLGIDPYYIGVGGTDLSKAQPNQYGFPIWEGHGNSHAAGRYQFQPATWEQYAKPLGISDFSAASQDAVFRAAYLDRGFGHWAPYNTPLAAHIGQPAPAPLARIENPLGLPSGGQTQASEADQSWLDKIPPSATPASSPWLRLMQLSAIAQSAHIAPVLTKYDPRKGMIAQPEPIRGTPMAMTQIMQHGTGELPGSAQVPRQAQSTSAELPVGPSTASRQAMSRVGNSMIQPTQYVTRLGMRPYYVE